MKRLAVIFAFSSACAGLWPLASATAAEVCYREERTPIYARSLEHEFSLPVAGDSFDRKRLLALPGNRVAIGGSIIEVLDLDGAKSLGTLEVSAGPNSYFHCASPDGHPVYFLPESNKSHVFIPDSTGYRRKKEFGYYASQVSAGLCLPDPKRMIFGFKSGQLALMDWEEKEALAEFTLPMGRHRDAASGTINIPGIVAGETDVFYSWIHFRGTSLCRLKLESFKPYRGSRLRFRFDSSCVSVDGKGFRAAYLRSSRQVVFVDSSGNLRSVDSDTMKIRWETNLWSESGDPLNIVEVPGVGIATASPSGVLHVVSEKGAKLGSVDLGGKVGSSIHWIPDSRSVAMLVQEAGASGSGEKMLFKVIAVDGSHPVFVHEGRTSESLGVGGLAVLGSGRLVLLDTPMLQKPQVDVLRLAKRQVGEDVRRIPYDCDRDHPDYSGYDDQF